jgi:protein-export membrane protein SecD
LEFKLVDEEGDIETALKGNIPEGDTLLYQRVVDPKTGGVKKVPYLLREKTLMTGEVLKDARVALDSHFHAPYISMEFDDIGAKLFEQITGANVKKRLAIILDDNVYSAPVIQEKIAGGRAQITGRFTTDEASELAIVLRAGALPAPVKIIEERTVGPSLGQDSIRMGIISVIISALLIVLFMIFYYRLSGVIADVALILNLILVFGILALFRATLTLPGIAGLVLSIGMAVDANILIHERIKEELRWGKTPRAAIDQGYHRAFTTIIDSNVTPSCGALFISIWDRPGKGFCRHIVLGDYGKYLYRRVCYEMGLRFFDPQSEGQTTEHLILPSFPNRGRSSEVNFYGIDPAGYPVRFYWEEKIYHLGFNHRYPSQHRLHPLSWGAKIWGRLCGWHTPSDQILENSGYLRSPKCHGSHRLKRCRCPEIRRGR